MRPVLSGPLQFDTLLFGMGARVVASVPLRQSTVLAVGGGGLYLLGLT
jgi:hypothetical protein